jgi:small-conductance mechanosensitive channel
MWRLWVLVLVLQGCLAEAAERGTPAAPATGAPRPASPAAVPGAIPVAEVATRAAQVPELLRTLTEPVAETAETEAIKKRLQDARAQIDLEMAAAETILRGHPTLDVIQLQQQLWRQRQAQTNEWLSALTRRATLLQSTLTHLAEIKMLWGQTRAASVASSAPGAIVDQIDGALAAIGAAEAPLAARRTAVLDLQSVVATEVARSTDLLARFTQAQQRAVGGILTQDSSPLWVLEAWTDAHDTLGSHVRELITTRRDDIIRYVKDPSRGMPLHAAVLATLVIVFVAARRRIRQHDGTPAGTDPGASVFDRPYAAALAVTLLFVSAPMSSVPQSLRNLGDVLTLVPVIRLLGPALDSRLVVPVYAVAVLFTVDSLRQTIGGVPVLEQAILALEMIAGMAVLGHSLTVGALGRGPAAEETERLRALRVGARFVLFALAAGLVAGTLGYMRLARLVASGVFSGGALALTLSACVQVICGVVALALRGWPLRLLRMVQSHRELLERRALGIVLWLAVAAWISRVLDYVGLFQPALAVAQTALETPLGRGAIRFSARDVLEFALTVWLAYLVSVFVRFVLREDVYPRTRIPRGISYALSSLLNYVILTLGFLLALGTIGLDLTKVTILAGAFGVGLGLGLQSIVNNFVSGLILLFERPIRVGDVVEVSGLLGEVSRIGTRASTVRTYQGADIIVPNAQLVTERVTNWTASDRRRRIDIPVGVDYRSAPEKVMQVLEGVARAHPEVSKQPAPQASFKAFGDSAINFELRAWINHFERSSAIQTELAVGIHAALREAGMTMPFPQREVRLVRDGTDAPRGGAP